MYSEFYEELSLTKQHFFSFSPSSFFFCDFLVCSDTLGVAMVLSQRQLPLGCFLGLMGELFFRRVLVGGQGGEPSLLCSLFLYLLHFEIETELLLGGVISFIDLE